MGAGKIVGYGAPPPCPGILTLWSPRWGLRTCIYISFLDNSNTDGINDAGNSETSGIRRNIQDWGVEKEGFLRIVF